MSSAYIPDLGPIHRISASPGPFLVTDHAAQITAESVLYLPHMPSESDGQPSPSSETNPAWTHPNTESPSPTIMAQSRRALRCESALILNDGQRDDMFQASPQLASIFPLPQLIKIGTTKFWQSAAADIPLFNPLKLESYKSLKPLLDARSNAGLPEARFRRLFKQCLACRRLMTDRSKEYHECPSGPASCDSFANHDLLILRLDCYNGGVGISEAHFEQVFPQCIDCELFMTRWAALNHVCNSDLTTSQRSPVIVV